MEREQIDPVRRADRLEWRVDSLDRWRAATDKRVAVLESEVLTERESRRLSEALAARGNLRLTRMQRQAGILLAAVAVADLVLSIARLK